MPGTIHVAVLEFEGLPSSSPAPSMFIKISMGNREYQTWDRGEFSFPLTRLQDNLIVSLQDAEGNEISSAGIQTMSVIEKGLWDDIFYLQGGGQVHLKLQFILSEHERNRIRVVRESALKKKRVMVLDDSPRYSEVVTVAGGSVASYSCSDNELSDVTSAASSQDSQANNGDVTTQILRPSTPGTFLELLKSGNGEKGGTFPLRGPTSPNVADRYELHPMASVKDVKNPESAATGKNFKTPSSSVRKMISAFETSLTQDTRPSRKLAAGKSPTNHIESSSEDRHSKAINQTSQSISKKVKNPIVMGDLQQAQIRNTREEHFGFLKDLDRSQRNQTSKLLKEPNVTNVQSKETDLSINDTPKTSLKERSTTVSERIHQNHASKLQPNNLPVKQDYSGGISVRKEAEEEILCQTDMQGAYDSRLRAAAYCDDENYSFESSGMWIFPDDPTCLCVTSAGEKAVYSFGGWHLGVKKYHTSASENIGKFQSGMQFVTEAEIEKVENKYNKLRKTRNERSSDDASGGPIGQAIKAAIFLGFGLLVLLTRRREPGNSNINADDDLLFTTPEYMDEDWAGLEEMKIDTSELS